MYEKPFLSRYEFIMRNNSINPDFTVRTKAPSEVSDDDEYHLESTMVTEVGGETTDPDEYIIGSTSRRRSLGDEDEYYSFGTTMTRTIEDSDPDFFMVFKENQ